MTDPTSEALPDTPSVQEAVVQHPEKNAKDKIDKAEAPSSENPTPEPSTVQDLKCALDLVVRELGRIQQALARIEGRTGASTGDAPLFSRTLVGIKELLTREAISSARERRSIHRAVADLQAQVESLRQGDRFSFRRTPEVPRELQRVGIFVDVQNIFYAAKQFNARLDFEKLLAVAVGERRLIRAIAYVVQSPEVDQSGFISMLQQKSYEVRRKDLRLRSDGSAKGDWDMGMAIDIIGLVDKLDVVVLVTGDGDFVSLVNLIKTIGPRVEVISFPHNTARDLVQSADLHVPVEEALLMRLPDNGGDRPQAGAGRAAVEGAEGEMERTPGNGPKE